MVLKRYYYWSTRTSAAPITLGSLTSLCFTTQKLGPAPVRIYTAILPIGSDGITLEAELDGDITPDLVKEGKIIYSRAGRQQFGNITKLIEFQDVTETVNLKNKAARQLALGFGTKAVITCQAVDLGFTADEITKFRVGRNTFVYSDPHGLSAAFPLMEIELNLDSPGSSPITLGGTTVSFTGSSVADNRDLQEAMGRGC